MKDPYNSATWAAYKRSSGERTWLVAMALANGLADKNQAKQTVRGYRMPKGTWVYSVVIP